jgi:P2 family phage contractile tail tube protein
MGLPRTLKDMMLFNEGLAYLGEAASVTLPKLTRKMEEWRGAGMSAPLKLDMGMEALEMESSFGGPMRDILRQFGATKVNGIYLRFAGTYQRDDSGAVDMIEIVVRGRHEEIDRGESKPGEAGEFKVKTAAAYYKESWNGRVEMEFDPLNMVEIVNGVDLMAQRRAALGMF